jgi:hypothetical protein
LKLVVSIRFRHCVESGEENAGEGKAKHIDDDDERGKGEKKRKAKHLDDDDGREKGSAAKITTTGVKKTVRVESRKKIKAEESSGSLPGTRRSTRAKKS